MKLTTEQREELKKMLREEELEQQEKELTLDEKIEAFKKSVAFKSAGSVDEYIKKHRYNSDGMVRRPISLKGKYFNFD